MILRFASDPRGAQRTVSALRVTQYAPPRDERSTPVLDAQRVGDPALASPRREVELAAGCEPIDLDVADSERLSRLRSAPAAARCA